MRFAPSPTGPLHIGGVRTALYNYLFAKQSGGKILLRIEDTDSQRFVLGAEEYINNAFKWLGITFDEGEGIGGDYGPYKQSQRKAIYKQYADLLVEREKAYIAFDTAEELEKKRSEIANFQYDSTTRLQMKNSLTLSAHEVKERIAQGHPYVIRFKVEPNQEVVVNDLIRGEVKVNSSVLDDKVIYKSSDSLPTYHLANIVDDYLMKITHVIRGEEWLPSAPLHVLMYNAFGWNDSMPAFAHLPLLLKPEGNGKLSKRDGDRLGFPVFPIQWEDPVTHDISTGYRESGYYPEAIVNFLALLGWNPGGDEEVLSLAQMTSLFSLQRCSKSGAKFDIEKAKWFNHQYLLQRSDTELAQECMPTINKYGHMPSLDFVEKVVALVKERMTFVEQVWEHGHFFFEAPNHYDEKTVKKRWKPETPDQMSQLALILESLSDFSAHNQEQVVKKWIEEQSLHIGSVMNAFRLAVVGESKGPHMFDITALIGKEETLKRIRRAIEVLP